MLTVTVTGIFFCSLFVDYRHFDAANIAPRYEFGFGMSYTEFEYSGLSVTLVQDVGDDQDGQLETNWLAGKPGPQGVGSSTALWLHRAAYTVSFTVKNTGQVVGTEVCNSLSLPELIEFIARAKTTTTRYLRSIYISLLVRASRRLSCAGSQTWSCNLVRDIS